MSEGIANAANAESSSIPAPCRTGVYWKTVSTRTFPGLAVIGACLAAAALPLGFSAPAHAQTLVSNTGRSTVGHTACVRGSNPVIKLDCAQGFKTGQNTRGYSLSSIQLDTHTAPGSGTLTVTVRNANGSRPGDTVLSTLTNPSNMGTGLQTFTASGGLDLARNTRYFVHINFNGNGTRPRWNLATDDRQDSGEAKGWSIGDHRYTRPSGGTGSWEGGGGVYTASIQIKVRGSTLAPAAPSLSAAPGETRVALTWDNPANNTIDKYEYRRKTGTGGYGAWIDIGGASTTAYTVTGLTSSTAYTFQVRATNVGGNGAAATVTTATLPAAPTNLWPDPGDGAVTLSWTNPGGDTITSHEVSTDGGTTFSDIPNSAHGQTNATGYTVTGLDNGTGYTFKLRARNASGRGRASTATATPRAPPAAPADLSATAGDGQVTLSWTNPGDNTITKYQYRRKTGDGAYGNWTDIGGSSWTTTTHTVTGLGNGTQYGFQLRAVNAIDEGPASTKNATPVWGAPANLSATPFIDPDTDESQVILSWTDPGDSTIAKYQVNTDGGETFDNISGSSATTTSYAVTGLTNGTTYTLALRAANADASVVGTAATATARPLWPAPTNLKAAPGNEKVELTWDGNSAIAHYRVHTQSSGATLTPSDVESSGSGTTTATVENLFNGTEYTFTVQAVDTSVSPAVITGLPSSTTATPKPVPATPDLSAAAGSQQVTLTWTDPDDSSITKYRYRQKVGAATFGDWIDIAGSNADTIEHTVTGLTNGTEYTFTLLAVNDAGESLLSDDKTATPLWPAPTGLVAAPNDGEVTLQWDKGDSGIAKYHVRAERDTANTDFAEQGLIDVRGVQSGSKILYTVENDGTDTPMVNGIPYTFTVRAVPADENSTLDPTFTSVASSITATPAVDLPDKPTGLTAMAGDGEVTLSWDDPDDLTLTGYDYSTDGGETFTAITGLSAAPTSYTVTGLTNNTAYNLALRAVNASGEGPSSDTVTATPIGPPSAPGELSATQGDHQQTTLSWANPSDSTILNYEYRQAHGDQEENEADIEFGDWSEWKDIGGSRADTTGHTVTGLFNGFVYKFEVRAVNDSGKGGAAEVTATPLWPAPAVTTTPDDGRVWLQWDTWFDVEEYIIEVSPQVTGTPYPFGPEQLTGPVKTGPGNLSNGTLYTFTVKAWGYPDATNPLVVVPFSKTATVTAKPAAPPTPAAPTGLSATPGDSRVVLKWDDPGNPTITGYEYTTDGGTTVISIEDSDADTTQDTVDDLTNNTAYTFAVRATNASGDSPWSNSATATPIVVPNAPGNLSAAPGDGRVALSWDKPSNDAPIGSYEVSTDGGANYSAIADSDDGTTAHTVMDLANGTEYTLALRAVNSAGDGLAATVTATPMAAPAAPTNLLATAGATEVALTWDDPDDDTITGYKVSTDGGETFADIEGTDISENDTDNTLAYTVPGLTNGTLYTFVLRAVNTYGEGAAATVTAPTLPAAPTDFTAERGDGGGEVTLSWVDPNNDTVSGYQVSTDGGTTFIDIEGSNAATTTHTVTVLSDGTGTGLTNGTEYTFKLRAVNLSGAGAASLEATATPLWPAPNPAAAPGDGQVTLTWDTVDSGIARYAVHTRYTHIISVDPLLTTFLSPGSGDRTTVIISGLTNRTDYTFTVQAVDTSGDDTVITGRAGSVDARPVPVPDAPEGLAAMAANGQAVLTWDDPNDSSITKYQVRSKVKDSNDSTYTGWANIAVTDPDAPPTTTTVTGLTNGREYTVELRAVNASGHGDPSSVDAEPKAVPNAPANLSATPGGGKVTLTWTDPGDSTIDKYQVSTDGGGTFANIDGSGADTVQHTVTGLTNGTEYTFAVRAVNVPGNGPASTVTATPIAPPAPPDLQKPKPGYRQVELEWADPNDSTITGYQVSTGDGGKFAEISGSGAGTTKHTVTGLTNGTEYRLAVRAVNEVGAGGVSAANATPFNNPPSGSDKELSAKQNKTYVFTMNDFDFRDDDAADMLDHVKITSLPAADAGTLSLNGKRIPSATLDQPQKVTKTELIHRRLTYTPPPNAHGDAITSFEFKVSDGMSDSVAYTITVNVAQVLSARFGAAAYKVDEGGGPVTVEVTVGQQAAAARDIPITVTRQGRTVAEDYTVTVADPDVWDPATGTVTLKFAMGDTTRSLTIEATEQAKQDKNFHDVRVALKFGTLPANVTKGAPSAATVTIVDAEGVVVRARFRRLNDEILSKHALTLADAANRAIGARMDDPCGKQAAAYTLAGGSTIAGALRSNAQAIEDGTLTLDDVLAGSSFRLPLAAANDDLAGGAGGPVLWGRGERQALESTESAFAWDGTVLTGQIGIDGCLREDLLTGLALSRSIGEFDYSDGTGSSPVRGDYESRMTSVHPYLGWTSPQGLDLWATLGYGRGEIEIDDEQVRDGDPDYAVRRSDMTLKTAAAGASGPLMTDESPIAGGTMALGLRSEASWAQVEVEGEGDDGLIAQQTVNANRLRLALEGSHEQALASGGSLTPSLELGLRHDGGDGITGTGIEIGGGLRYRDPATGLTVEGHGRVLTGQSNYREWGLGGSVRLDPGAGGRGFSFSLFPAWGETASGVDRLWDQDVAELASDDTAANDNVPQMRLDSELGYGFGTFGGQGLLTPYGGFSLAGEGSQRYRIGSRFEIGSSLSLSLEGERREPANNDTAEHGVMLRMQASW